MLAKSISALAVFAFAAQAAASKPMPYKPQVMKMSVRDLFGVERRQDGSGYQPSQSICGTGNTCAEACGAGYETCASNDNMVHCYDTSTAQTCCPDDTGNSCDAGYYCTGDTAGSTWCCPNSMDLTACAAAYSVTGGLTSEIAKPTSTVVSSSSSAVITSTSSASGNSTLTVESTGLSTSCTSTLSASATFPASNTTSIKYTASGTPSSSSPTTVSTSAADATAPAAILAMVAGAAFAALL